MHLETGASVFLRHERAVSSNTQSAVAEPTGVSSEAESEKNTGANATVLKFEAKEEAGKVRGEENLKFKGEKETVGLYSPQSLHSV